MFYVVIIILCLLEVAILTFNYNVDLKKKVFRTEFSKLKHWYMAFSVFVIATMLIVSRVIDDSLLFFNVDSQYSTGVWAAIICAGFYVVLFQEFTLDGWIKSKDKEWKLIEDKDLIVMIETVITWKARKRYSDVQIFTMILVSLNEIQHNVKFSEKDDALANSKRFESIYYSTSDARIEKFLNLIIKLLLLKK